MNSDPKECCILVPSRGRIDPACEIGLKTLAQRGYQLRIMSGPWSIDQIRSQMATDALADGFRELFWIDDDVVFNPDDVDRLRCSDLPVIGGVYPKKGERELAVRWKPSTTSVVLGEGGGIFEIQYAATGFLLTRAIVYSTLAEKLLVDPNVIGHFGRRMAPYFQPMTVRDGDIERYLAEDWSFCHRLAQAGIPIHVDTRPRLLHVGRYAYSWEDLIPREPMASLTVRID